MHRALFALKSSHLGSEVFVLQSEQTSFTGLTLVLRRLVFIPLGIRATDVDLVKQVFAMRY